MSVLPQGQIGAKEGKAVGFRDTYALKMEAEEARSTGQLSRGSGCSPGSPAVGLLSQRTGQALWPSRGPGTSQLLSDTHGYKP